MPKYLYYRQNIEYMPKATAVDDPRLFIYLMRNHVLDPIERSLDIVSTHRQEIRSEQHAFENFIRYVREVDVEYDDASQLTSGSKIRNESNTLREAYEKTILAVDHYETVYGESVVENAVTELGSDAAAILAQDKNVPLTPIAKRLLIERAQMRVEERRTGAVHIAAEKESLEENYRDIRRLVTELNSTIVPGWDTSRFNERKADILRQRQAHLNGQHGEKTGHEGCEYLYRNQDWRYPVLTSVARLCEVTVV